MAKFCTASHCSMLFRPVGLLGMAGVILYFLYMLIDFYMATTTIIINKHTKPVAIVGKRFLSLGLDTINIYNDLETLKLNSPKLIDLTSRLSPSYLRFGGTMADRLIFQEEETDKTFPLSNQTIYDVNSSDESLPFFKMSGSEFLEIANFCKKTQTKLIFDLNVLLRNGDDWDPTNAIKLIQFAKKHNLELDWQLGNEPNSFLHVFNVSVSPEQLAKDFNELKNILKKYYPKSLLVGPDTTRPQPNRPECVRYMKEFLETAADVVDAMAWHQYYLNGRTATLNEFWDPETLNLLQFQINSMVNNTRDYQQLLDMWLTETSSAYGGGAPMLSNSFAAIPLWLDKLGTAAKNGIQVVARQSLLGGNYSLIDENHNPLPDYWVSFLYKKLVGNKVVECSINSSKYQRFYCHCAKDGETANLVIYGMNLHHAASYIYFDGSAVSCRGEIDEYIFTAPNGDRMSQQILLNGVLLKYTDKFPNIVPRRTIYTILGMPPYSFGFWKIYDTSVTYC